VKLSIYLPTRNGGALLEDCLRSILSQEGADFELVVSDNASDDRTPELLRAFGTNPRLHTMRQTGAVPVVENWTAALEACTGDYLLMIGDDDYLLPGCLERLQHLLEEYSGPDCLTFEAYGFAFPNAMSEGSPAYYSEHLFPFAPEVPERGELSRALRRELVRHFFRFEFHFCPNLQTTLVARRSLGRMRNGVFREPYPDFYALHALMLLVDRWVRVPDRLALVGISPKSFGRTLKEGGSDEGRAMLGITTDFPRALPGSDMLNGWHRTLQNLLEDYGPELDGIDISRANYVYRQGYEWYLAYRMGWIDRRELWRRIRLLSPGEWFGFAHELARRVDLDMIRRHARVDERSAIASVWPNMQPVPEIQSVVELADRVTSRRSR
jgi:glycosyltransferase involved in cell wall biosynthesis